MSYENPRIKLQDSMEDMLKKMASGNPGALSVLLKIIEETPKVDPQNAMGSITPILMLDTLDIYEGRIWLLYKDVCGEDIVKTLACIRGCQLNIITDQQLADAVDGKETTLDPSDVLKKVKERLRDFDTSPRGLPAGDGKKPLICQVCEKNEAVGAAAVPCVPMSVAYCKECLEANAHPWWVLVANTVCINGLENAHDAWKKMVTDTCKHLGRTLEEFNQEVKETLEKEGKIPL